MRVRRANWANFFSFAVSISGSHVESRMDANGDVNLIKSYTHFYARVYSLMLVVYSGGILGLSGLVWFRPPIRNASTSPTKFTATVGAGLVPALVPDEAHLPEEMNHTGCPCSRLFDWTHRRTIPMRRSFRTPPLLPCHTRGFTPGWYTAPRWGAELICYYIPMTITGGGGGIN
jgi:hypothetical protein